MSAVLTARGNAFLSPPALAALRHTAAQGSAVDSIGHPRRAIHQEQPLQLPRTDADRKRALHAEPLSGAALTAVSSGLNAFSPLCVAVVYFTGVLSGWMLAKIAFAFFWARKHARYLLICGD